MISLQAYKTQILLSPTTAVSTSRSASFDFLGSEYAVVRVIQSPSGSNAYSAISVLHADSVPSQATQYTTITADLSAQNTNSHETVYYIDTKSKARYGKIIITPGTNAADAIATAVHLMLGRLEQQPSNTAGMVSTTNDVVTIVA